MRISKQKALSRLDSLAGSLNGNILWSYRQAIQDARDNADLNAAIAALEKGNLSDAYDALNVGRAAAMQRIRASIASAIVRAGVSTLRTDVPPQLRFHFSLGSERAAVALERMNLNVLLPVVQAQEAGLRSTLAYGLRNGFNPRETALQAREFVGLTEYDVSIIQTFELQLRSDPARALTRSLRDARYDPTVKKSAGLDGTPLTEKQIRAMTDAYANRLTDWRAETWSRTASLQAVREAQAASWKQIMDDSSVSNDRFVKTWVTTIDGRERDEHHDADGTTVGLDEEFPVDGGVQVPGDNAYNCRCTMVVSILPADPQRREDFQSDPSRQPRGEREQLANALGGALSTGD